MGNKYFKKLKKCSKQLIISDGEIISQLSLYSQNKVILSMLLLPYIALYCREAQLCLKIDVLDTEFDKQIIDLRNAIKLICGKYNKTEKSFLELDLQQDHVFKDMISNEYLKSLNLHKNIGVYFDGDGHVVGDTQLICFYLNTADKSDLEQKIKSYKLGENIGRLLSHINLSVGQNYKPCYYQFEKIPIGYIDYNTNVENNLFRNKEYKGLNLIMLHMLGMLGTNKYILQRICPCDNVWEFRNEYIIAHNIWTGLKTIKEHFNIDKSTDIDFTLIKKLVNEGQILFPSSFRNSMMHYDLIHDGQPCISEDLYRSDVMLYGLVETNFDGKNAQEYLKELRSYMTEIEDYLNSWFIINKSCINWDLQ